ncbi:MAG: alcohol dehydrogenase catalytic domain-containing protein [Phycisphaeraceae bacterium]|nr:alcohol dehydrogenase catalytic domain-containing protein [Phycisphaeraceae bacterium]
MTAIPKTQHAVQLTGPDRLEITDSKPVWLPGPHEMLARIEAVGLCFSDLKLLKQFDQHARKSDIVAGLDSKVLDGFRSYVPGNRPTVPGHEVVCRIVAVGDQVTRHKVGERCLVQTDYRDLPTKGSNAAFGYNFEGGLQEYVLLDERIVIDRQGERFLIPVGDERSASAIALVEPWACVEDSYVNRERQGLKPDGRLLVVMDPGREPTGLAKALADARFRGSLVHMGRASLDLGESGEAGIRVETADDLAGIADESVDDIIYYGHDSATIETLNDKLAARGMINIVLDGRRIDRPVNIGVGRIHYGMTRWTGTVTGDPRDGYTHLPSNGELAEGDRILIVGAGGPMGQMHVVRDVCSGIAGLSVVGTDFDQTRLDALMARVKPLAEANNVRLNLVHAKEAPAGPYDYIALMAPVPALVADAVVQSAPKARVNIFAGIPAPTRHPIDLNAVIEKKVFMFGTSGSVIEDMKIVLRKVEAGQLDTNLSVDAISGMAGAVDGIAAVENRTLAGKIIVYPMLRSLGLVRLDELSGRFPTVAAKLENGLWCRAAEEELLRVAAE